MLSPEHTSILTKLYFNNPAGPEAYRLLLICVHCEGKQRGSEDAAETKQEIKGEEKKVMEARREEKWGIKGKGRERTQKTDRRIRGMGRFREGKEKISKGNRSQFQHLKHTWCEPISCQA